MKKKKKKARAEISQAMMLSESVHPSRLKKSCILKTDNITK